MTFTTHSKPGSPKQLGFLDRDSEPADAPLFQITHEWLLTHATNGDAWNAAQLAAIGIAWPPRAGWKARAIGMRVSELQRRAFESGRTLESARCRRVAAPYAIVSARALDMNSPLTKNSKDAAHD